MIQHYQVISYYVNIKSLQVISIFSYCKKGDYKIRVKRKSLAHLCAINFFYFWVSLFNNKLHYIIEEFLKLVQFWIIIRHVFLTKKITKKNCLKNKYLLYEHIFRMATKDTKQALDKSNLQYIKHLVRIFSWINAQIVYILVNIRANIFQVSLWQSIALLPQDLSTVLTLQRIPYSNFSLTHQLLSVRKDTSTIFSINLQSKHFRITSKTWRNVSSALYMHIDILHAHHLLGIDFATFRKYSVTICFYCVSGVISWDLSWPKN